MDATPFSMRTGPELAQAVEKLLKRELILQDQKLDILLTNVALPDKMFTGCGAVVSKQTGLQVKHIFDLHNTGCVSCLYMLDLAHSSCRVEESRPL